MMTPTRTARKNIETRFPGITVRGQFDKIKVWKGPKSAAFRNGVIIAKAYSLTMLVRRIERFLTEERIAEQEAWNNAYKARALKDYPTVPAGYVRGMHVTEGMRISFSGSDWDIVEVAPDGKVYGVGGRGVLGNVITKPHWLMTITELSLYPVRVKN